MSRDVDVPELALEPGQQPVDLQRLEAAQIAEEASRLFLSVLVGLELEDL